MNEPLTNILNFGAIGLGFIFMYLAYKYFSEEQKKEKPNDRLINVGILFMLTGALISVFFGYLEFFGNKNSKTVTDEVLKIQKEISRIDSINKVLAERINDEAKNVSADPSIKTIKQSIGIAIIKEVQPTGQHGGGLSGDIWRIRKLNTIEGNKSPNFLKFTPANHTFLLPKGKYWIKGVAETYNNGSNRIRLFNLTDNTPEIVGTNAYSAAIGSSDRSTGKSLLSGLVELKFEKAFRLEQRTEKGNYDGNRTGIASKFDAEEVYAQLEIIKL